MKAQIVTFAVAALAVLSGIAWAQSTVAGFPDPPMRHSNDSTTASP